MKQMHRQRAIDVQEVKDPGSLRPPSKLRGKDMDLDKYRHLAKWNTTENLNNCV